MAQSGRLLNLGVVWLVQAILPTLLFLAYAEGYDMWEWAKTGNCPGMAPDIPPEPCTWSQFVDRDWGAFGLIGLVVYAIQSVLVATWCVLAWAGDRRLRDANRLHFRVGWLSMFALPGAVVFLFYCFIYGSLALMFAAPPVLVFVGLLAIARRWANPRWARVE